MNLFSPEHSENPKQEIITVKVPEIRPDNIGNAVKLKNGKYLLGRKPTDVEGQKQIEEGAEKKKQKLIYLEPETENGIEQVSKKQLELTIDNKGGHSLVGFKNLGRNGVIYYYKEHQKDAVAVGPHSPRPPRELDYINLVILLPADEEHVVKIEFVGGGDISGVDVILWRSTERAFYNQMIDRYLDQKAEEEEPTVPVINEPRK